VSNAQWNALVARDGHCQGKNCERGPGFCEAHHIWHWEHGGPTNLENLKLLCWWCHRKQHIEDALAGLGSWRK
jgi:5-methylcytosine-specific restriction endonuclease McrA